MQLEKGMIHVYTGEGKGKTTASLGLAMRAIGHGLKVYMVQFMKIGYTGEILNIMKHHYPLEIDSFNVTCKNQSQHDEEIKLGTFKGYCRDCFVPNSYDPEMAKAAFERGRKAVESGNYDLVIFDELNVVLNKKLLDLPPVLEMLKNKPMQVEVVCTGRNAPQEVMDAADYVTHMTLKKHPYMKGIYARKGIEF